MKKGDRVKVFQKPVTSEEYEGETTLVTPVAGRGGDGREFWMVRFDGEAQTCLRLIRPDSVIKAA